SIDFPLASSTAVNAINNRAELVGFSVQAGAAHGFVYSQNRFRTVDVPFAGTTSTQARSINDSGQVVGVYTSADCPTGCGFLAAPQPGTPPCTQTFGLGYSNRTLNLNFTIGSAAAGTWNTWLAVQNTAFKLW